MKKKLRKEFNKLLPSGFNVASESEFDINVYLKDRFMSITVDIEKQPTKEQLLEKAKRDYVEGTVFESSYSGEITSTGNFRCSDAHDAILTNGCNVYLNGDWNKIIKKPIFKLNNKFMYEGDELHILKLKDNWILKSRKITKREPLDLDYYEYFATKQEALNYVLEEAKERFPINSHFTQPKYNNNGIACDVILCKGFTSHIHSNYENKKGDGELVLWDEKEGWIAEPIKETAEEKANKMGFFCG
jgi:hypothetical protein